MPIHKIINGDGKYLPFALSKLRQLAAQAAAGSGYAARKFYVDDGSIIQLSVAGEQQYINMTSSLRYEFFASEHIFSDSFASPGYEGLITDPAILGGTGFVVGSIVRAMPDPTDPLPVSSQALPLDGDTPEWRIAPGDEGTFHKTVGNPDLMPIAQYPITPTAYAIHKSFEYTNWPGNSNASLVISTQCMAPGLNNQSGFLSAYAWSRLENVGAFTADYGLDVWPALYDSKGSKAGGPAYEDPNIWWRRAAVQTAGGRRFFICTDNVGRFQVYPVKDYVAELGDDFRYLPPTAVKQFTPPYPAWVTLPTIGTPQAKTASWLWAFNKDATRCVTCAFNSVPSEFLKPHHLRVAGMTALPEDPDTGDWITAREDIPGLVEFEIAITVTGPGDMDFDVEFSLGREMYSLDSGRFIFDAAYTLKDQGSMDVPEDMLITAEVECFTSVGGYEAGPVAAPLSPTAIALRGPGPQSVQAARRVESFLVVNVHNVPDRNGPVEMIRRPMWKMDGCRFLTADGVRRARLEAEWPYLEELYVGQLGPSSYTVLSPPPPVDAAAGWLGRIFALELRTMSLNYQLTDQIAGQMTQELWVYNEKVKEFVSPYGPPSAGPYAPCTEKIPSSATHLHQYMLGASLNTQWGSGFVIHPAGHWSHSMPRGGEGADVVKFKGRNETTHRELFNAAFRQTRPYSFYQGYYDPETREFGAGFAGTNDDLGSFRTTGVFITF